MQILAKICFLINLANMSALRLIPKPQLTHKSWSNALNSVMVQTLKNTFFSKFIINFVAFSSLFQLLSEKNVEKVILTRAPESWKKYTTCLNSFLCQTALVNNPEMLFRLIFFHFCIRILKKHAKNIFSKEILTLVILPLMG